MIYLKLSELVKTNSCLSNIFTGNVQLEVHYFMFSNCECLKKKMEQLNLRERKLQEKEIEDPDFK